MIRVSPEDLKRLALGGVVGAGEADERRVGAILYDLLNQPPAIANVHELAGEGARSGRTVLALGLIEWVD